MNDYKNIVNVNQIAESIEKTHIVLKRVRKSGNQEAVATWERILASLQFRWRDAKIEMDTNGRYSFQ
jgi:hypothetical protein